MIVGSVAFSLFMIVSSHPNGAFGMGLFTAVLLGVAWMVFGEKKNPRWRGRLRAEAWDAFPEAPIRPQVWPDGKGTAWVTCVRSSRTGEMANIQLAAHFAQDDLYYDEDVHVLPFKIDDPWYGAHRFERSCPCGPQIIEQNGERTLVIHIERV
jgi:hypothetical protein